MVRECVDSPPLNEIIAQRVWNKHALASACERHNFSQAGEVKKMTKLP